MYSHKEFCFFNCYWKKKIRHTFFKFNTNFNFKQELLKNEINIMPQKKTEKTPED